MFQKTLKTIKKLLKKIVYQNQTNFSYNKKIKN